MGWLLLLRRRCNSLCEVEKLYSFAVQYPQLAAIGCWHMVGRLLLRRWQQSLCEVERLSLFAVLRREVERLSLFAVLRREVEKLYSFAVQYPQLAAIGCW
jgi:hypothetical protein